MWVLPVDVLEATCGACTFIVGKNINGKEEGVKRSRNEENWITSVMNLLLLFSYSPLMEGIESKEAGGEAGEEGEGEGEPGGGRMEEGGEEEVVIVVVVVAEGGVEEGKEGGKKTERILPMFLVTEYSSLRKSSSLTSSERAHLNEQNTCTPLFGFLFFCVSNSIFAASFWYLNQYIHTNHIYIYSLANFREKGREGKGRGGEK